MLLEDYFEFLSSTDIRLKKHRLGIDTVLFYYLEGYAAEEIANYLPSLSSEEIYATITYYLHNRSQIDQYLWELERWREHLTMHWTNGGHIWGLLWTRPGIPIAQLAHDLHLVWDASEAEEWCDRFDWIPS